MRDTALQSFQLGALAAESTTAKGAFPGSEYAPLPPSIKGSQQPSAQTPPPLSLPTPTTFESDIDAFIAAFSIPLPPDLTLPKGLGSSLRGRAASSFYDVVSSQVPLPPPISRSASFDPTSALIPAALSAKPSLFAVPIAEEVQLGPLFVSYQKKQVELQLKIPHDITVADLKNLTLKQFNVTGSSDEWNLAFVDDSNAVPMFLDKNCHVRDLSLYSPGFEILLKRVLPHSFNIQISLDNGMQKDLSANVFSTARDVLGLLSKMDVEMEDDLSSWAIWKLPLDGSISRFLGAEETPFYPSQTQVRYIVKSHMASENEETPEDDLMLVKVKISASFSRNFYVQRGVSSLQVLETLFESLGGTKYSAFPVGSCLATTRDFENFNAIDLNDKLPELEDGCSLCVMYDGQSADLDTFDMYMSYIKDSESGLTDLSALNKGIPSLEELKTLLRSLSFSTPVEDATVPIEDPRQLIKKNTAVIADFLGVSTESEVKQVQAKLQDYFETNNSPVKEDEDENATVKQPRINKLAAMLGIDSETELAQFLLATASKSVNNNSNNNGTGDQDADVKRNRSAQKAARVLGVNGDTPKFRHRTISQYSGATGSTSGESSKSALPNIDESVVATSIRKMFQREATVESSSSVAERRKGKPVISNGQFSVKVYLLNQTYKTISIPVDMTAGQLLSMLMDKLNIHEHISHYTLNEDRRNEERSIDDGEKILNIVNAWSGRELLVFKKRLVVKKAISSDSLNTNAASELDKSRQNAARRAAKVANIFGISDKKSTVEGDNPEIVKFMKMLESFKDTTADSTKIVEIDRIYHEGWLIREDDTSSKSQSKNLWCFIENKQFSVVLKSKKRNTLSYKILEYDIRKHSQRKNCFELVSKAEATKIVAFYADSAKTCDSWIAAYQNAARAIQPQPSATSSDKISIENFQLHRVLGKGKFGKVLLCSQKTTGKVYAIKVIKKANINGMRQVNNNQNENKILRAIRHPFIISLFFAFQTVDRLYLIMEYVNGGELFFHVNNFGRFSEERVRFYTAELVSALQCLHGKGIIYRDLKLENILLDKDGHVKITDFGLSKWEMDSDDGVIAGTFEYLAPEVILGTGHSYAADWWALGLVAFEMLCGYHPFYCEDRDMLFKRICTSEVEYPDFIADTASDLFRKFFIRNPDERIGSGPNGAREIQDHPFFSAIDFELLFRKEIEPPFKPEVSDDFDVAYFDDEFTALPAELTPPGSISSFLATRPDAFKDFTFQDKSALEESCDE